MVSVAQWLEHWTVAPVVAGSNPVTHPGARSSMGKSAGLRTRRLRVRVAPGAWPTSGPASSTGRATDS